MNKLGWLWITQISRVQIDLKMTSTVFEFDLEDLVETWEEVITFKHSREIGASDLRYTQIEAHLEDLRDLAEQGSKTRGRCILYGPGVPAAALKTGGANPHR